VVDYYTGKENKTMKDEPMTCLLQELREFENFTVEAPTEKHAVHIKHIIKTVDPQSVIKSLELLRVAPDKTIFWVLDDYSVALGEVDS
jgi:hypothetical protein